MNTLFVQLVSSPSIGAKAPYLWVFEYDERLKMYFTAYWCIPGEDQCSGVSSIHKRVPGDKIQTSYVRGVRPFLGTTVVEKKVPEWPGLIRVEFHIKHFDKRWNTTRNYQLPVVEYVAVQPIVKTKRMR